MEAKRPKISITSAKAPPPQENPFSQLGLRGARGEPRTTTPLSQSVKRSRPEEDTTGTNSESLEAWEDRTLCTIFRVTLDEAKKTDYLGHHLVYLPGVREELKEQKENILLNVSTLEQSIIEAASSQERVPPLDYLLSCWKRVSKQFRTYKAQNDEAKLGVVKEARTLCMSYCILAVTEPALFGREPSNSNLLTPHLLVDQEDDRGLCHDFLLEITSRFAEDDGAKDVMVGAVEELSAQLAPVSMNGNFKPYVGVCPQTRLLYDS